MAKSQERMAASYSCFTHAPSCVKDMEEIQKIQLGSDRCRGVDYAQSQQKDNNTCKALPQGSSSSALKCSSHTLVNSSLLALLRGGQNPMTRCPLKKTEAEGESKVLWGLTHEQKMSLLIFCAYFWKILLICLKKTSGDPWPISPLHLVLYTSFLPEGILCSLAWRSWQLLCVCWWTSPLLFSLAVNASGNTPRKKLALLLSLMHLNWAYRILGLQSSPSSSLWKHSEFTTLSTSKENKSSLP